MKIDSTSLNESKEDSKKKVVDTEDCSSVMHPEMARNYEDNEPCNDGTKTRREKQ